MAGTRNDDDGVGILFTKAVIAGSASSSFCFAKICLGFFPSFVTPPDDYVIWINSSLDQLQPYAQSITLCWLIMSWFYLVRNLENGNSLADDEKKSSTSSSDSNETKRRRTWSRKILLLASATLVCLSLMFTPEGLNTIDNSQVSSAHGNSTIIRLDYKVDNMDCGGCVRAVEAILSKQSGVVSAKVLSLELGDVEVYLNKELVENYHRKEFDKILNDALMLKGYELHQR